MGRGSRKKADRRKAILYCRVSTEEQAREGVSLEAQEKTLRAYCSMKELEIIDLVIDNGVSAGKCLSSRPGGKRLVEAISARQVGSVVAWKLDRLFRNASECLTVTEQWDRAGVALHLVDLGGQSIDTTSAVGRFFLTMLAGMAELERNMVRERTAHAMQHKQSNGEYTGGYVPYGWRVGPDGTHLVPHKKEQAIIHKARKLRGTGMSLRLIGEKLVKRGMLPRSGGQWHAETVKALLKVESR